MLYIGGVSAAKLAADFQTPLYVYDQKVLEDTAETFLTHFQSEDFATKILYASKAFQGIELLNLYAKKGIGLDVVSGGELFAALQSQLPVERIYFHGNNKTPEELTFALISGVQHIVVDNYMELQVIDQLVRQHQQPLNICLRLNVGVEAHTHEYIVTSHVDSKFGMAFESAECQACLQLIEANPYLVLEGLHSHIGSQIFDTAAWYASIDILTGYLKEFSTPLALNIGGGFGIAYTANDDPQPIEGVLESLVHYVERSLKRQGLEIAELVIEPGRSLVGDAGSTLYTLGYQKETPGKTYYFVDGGMGDNMRPSLYQAEYACDIANRMDEPKTQMATIAGKYCESGDVLIKEAPLPPAQPGDLLVIYKTGAYGYSMSSAYNRNPIPGVVFVKDGVATEVVRRQSYEDLIRNEIYSRGLNVQVKEPRQLFDDLNVAKSAAHEG